MNRVRNIIVVFFLGLVGILLQGTVLKSLLPDILVPNLLLALVIFLAFYENSPFGALLAFILGLEVDLYSGHPLLLGPNGGAYVATFGIIASLSQRIFVESGFAVLIVTISGVILSAIIHIILVYEFNSASMKLFPMIIVSAVVTGLVTPILFKFFRLVLLRRNSGLIGRSRSAGI